MEKNIHNMNINKLWADYKSVGDVQAREGLILHYAPLVKYIAGRLAINLPDSVEFDDLVSYGTFGLLDALDKFDLDRDIKFETYASTRIRGAILDGLRSADWIPRSVRAKARKLEQQIQMLEHQLGRSPEDQEVADALELDMDKYHAMLEEVKGTALISLDEVVNPDSGDEPISLINNVRAEQAAVDEGLLKSELHHELARAIDQLPERERMVVSLYYHEGLTLKEIGHVLEVSESRICQMHTKAILTLRSKLNWA